MPTRCFAPGLNVARALLQLALVVCTLAGFAPMASAADQPGYRAYVRAGTFANVREDLNDAIIKRGFVVDHVGRFNFMLERTADVAGKPTGDSGGSPYKDAEYLQFCPALLTHDGVAASPFYIANCPITIFIFELRAEPGKVHVGYRLPVASTVEAMAPVHLKLVETLDAIAREATK